MKFSSHSPLQNKYGVPGSSDGAPPEERIDRHGQGGGRSQCRHRERTPQPWQVR
jgi:hypothetical protein